VTATTAIEADEDRGTLTASTNKFSLKSGVDSQGREREFIEGFLASTHIDKGNDEFTVDALKSMAEDINTDSESIDAVFNEIDEEDFKNTVEEANIGNVEHMNNPAFPFADTRTVPAFKTTRAEVREMQDGEKGLWVKGILNSDGLPGDTISAIKNSIKDGFLKAFSVEFKAKKVRRVQKKNRVVRIIEDAIAKGAALTGRPMNPAATMTDAMLKSMAMEYKVEYAYEVGDNVSWNETSGTVRDRTKDSCFNEEIDGDFEVCGTEEDPAYLIEVDNDEETMVAHKQSLFTGKSEGDSQHTKDESKNDTTMTDGEQPDDEPEASEPEKEEGKDVEGKSEGETQESGESGLKEQVAEIKSDMEQLKETNESLREENEELKSELEDLKTVQEIKSELDEVKSLFEDVELEDGARVPKQETKNRDVSDGEEDNKAEWKSAIDGLPEGYLETEGKSMNKMAAFAKNHGVSTEEVKNYVNRD